jgi:hypothetical protein
MTTGSGQITSYDNTTPLKRTITDRIIMADPYDITTMLALGLDNSSKFQFVNTPNRTYEWLEDSYPAVSCAAGGTNLTGSTNTTTITDSAANFKLFHVGDIIDIGGDATPDLAYVSSLATPVLTVIRGFGGGTAVSHPETSVLYIRYNARIEGAANTDSPWTEVTNVTNCSTIFHKSVNVTRDDVLFPNYGMNDLKEYRISMNMDILMEQLNRLPYFGVRAAGTSSTARSAGGFHQFISTNKTAAGSAALTRKMIDDEFMQIYAAGGKTNLILCDAWGQYKINSFYEGFVETARSERIGGIMIKQLMHPITGVLVDVVVDRHCRSGYMYLLDTRHVGYITIDPFFYEDLAKTGDFTTGQTIGEYGFVLAYEKSHSMITAYSTTA